MAAQSVKHSLEAPRALSERVIAWALMFCGWVSVGTTVGIVAVLAVRESLAFFGEVSLASSSPTLSGPRSSRQTLRHLAAAVGTLLTFPSSRSSSRSRSGLLAAIYLSPSTRPARLARVLKPVLEILAGVPTVVYGYFALTSSRRSCSVHPGARGFNGLSPPAS
jgi:phosphate transport system permease protein